MKRKGFLLVLLALTLTLISSVALAEGTGTQTVAEHEHVAYCDNPGVCHICGEAYTGNSFLHRSSHYEFNERTHWEVCDACNEIHDGPWEHIAYCDSLGVCYECGAPYTGTNIEHVGSRHEEGNETLHWEACDQCGGVVGFYEEHMIDCSNPGVCAYCGVACTEENASLYHTGSEIWLPTSDGTQHFLACSDCKQRSEAIDAPADHWAYCDNLGVCGACGAIYACKEVRHAHTHWVSDATTHWEVCDDCGTITSKPKKHDVLCTKPGVCNVCNDACPGVEITHKGSYGYQPTQDGEQHIKICKACGEPSGEKPADHWAYCDAPGVCADCGMEYACKLVKHTDSTKTVVDGGEHYRACRKCGAEVPGTREKHYRPCSGLYLDECEVCNTVYTGDNVHHFWKGTVLDKGDYHEYICRNCGQPIPSMGTKHEVLCWEPGVCRDCGAVCTGDNALIVHRSHDEYDAITHWEVCDECGMVSEPEAHVSSGAHPGRCDICGAPVASVTEPTMPPTPAPAPTDTPEPSTATPIYDESIGKLTIPDDPTFAGFAAFEDGLFYFTDGQQRTDYVGPVEIGGTYYAFEHGRVQTENMMQAFEGGLFAFNGGKLRTELTGLAEYDGEQFVFDHGQYQRDACGPYLDPISGRWVYVNYGQYYPITDMVSYNGEVFYFVNGELASGFTGIVRDFNGTGLYIASGQHYKVTDLINNNGQICYVVNGVFAEDFTGTVTDFAGTPFYVVNGVVQ